MSLQDDLGELLEEYAATDNGTDYSGAVREMFIDLFHVFDEMGVDINIDDVLEEAREIFEETV